MKKIFLAVFILCCTSELFSQAKEKPTEVTEVVRKKINSEVEREILQLKPNLEKKKYQKAEIEFILDTTRIELFYSKYMDYDYSDYGMKTATAEATEKYDKLLNKYYQKLMAVLKGEDKQVLVQSQRAWMSFRDKEIELIGVLTKDEYSGGGTIQTLIYSSQVYELVRKRVVHIFSHYTGTQEIE